MKKHCSFSHIGQYRNIVRTITERTRYVGKDENGNAIYDNLRPLPVQTWKGTIKTHGTNAGVTMNKDGEIWAQSMENIITVESDNAGFAFFVESHKDIFRTFFEQIDFKGYDYVTIFGEFAGGNIQKNVAINGLPKMFIIFDIKRSYDTIEQGDNIYSTEEEIKQFRSNENNFYNVYDFETYEVEIDFNNPEIAQNKIVELTLQVENECPIGRYFGSIGIGEGIVFSYIDENGVKSRFKSKGERHSVSKVRKLASVDIEKVNSINEFVEYAVTENRLNQGLEKIFGIGGEIDVTKTGDFLRWVVGDVIKEEMDTMVENGLEPKQVAPAISKKGKNWLFEKLNQF